MLIGVPAETRPGETRVAATAETVGVPAVADLPFGHVPHNCLLPLGVRAGLDADAGQLTLLEPAVREPGTSGGRARS